MKRISDASISACYGVNDNDSIERPQNDWASARREVDVAIAQAQLEADGKDLTAEIRELFKELETKYSDALILGKPLEEHSWYRRLKGKHIKEGKNAN